MRVAPPPQRLPQRNAVIQLGLLQRNQRLLRRPQCTLGGQHRQVIAASRLITFHRDIQRLLFGGNILALGVQLFTQRLATRKRIGDIFKRALNRFLIGRN